MGNTYNRVYIWCCKYGENRYCEGCANKQWCVSKHTGLLNSCLGKWYLIPFLVVPLISARVPLISTRVSAHCQATLLAELIIYITSTKVDVYGRQILLLENISESSWNVSETPRHCVRACVRARAHLPGSPGCSPILGSNARLLIFQCFHYFSYIPCHYF